MATLPRSSHTRRDATMALRHGVIAAGVLLTGVLLAMYVQRHEIIVDFRDSYWVAARAMLRGASPYAWTHAQVLAGVGFAYPAFTVLALAPLGALPLQAASVLVVVGLVAAVPLTLWILGVRDLAVYGLALLQWPVINAWQSGNITLVLAVVAALAWRYRDRPLLCAAFAALAVSLKPFVWPLLLWLLVTRRYRALLAALIGALVVNLAAFAMIGLDQISAYIHIAQRIASAGDAIGYGLPAVILRAGGSDQLGLIAMAAAAMALAVLTVRAGRRGHDLGALALACSLALVASPLVWNHYFALLIVPVAIAEPRPGRIWLLLLPLWLCPSLHVSEWQAALAWAVTGIVLARLLASGPAGAESLGQATNIQVANWCV